MQIAIVSLFDGTISHAVLAAQRSVLAHFAPRSRRHWRVRLIQKRVAVVSQEVVEAVVREQRCDVVVVLGAGMIPVCESACERIIDIAMDGRVVVAATLTPVASTTNTTTSGAVHTSLRSLSLFACSRASFSGIDWCSLVAEDVLPELGDARGPALTRLSARHPSTGDAQDGAIFALRNAPLFQHLSTRDASRFRLACADVTAGRAQLDRAPAQSLPPIYWINLDRSAQRRARMETRFSEQRLAHTRISAIDGNNDHALQRAIAAVGVPPRVAACSASHLMAIARAYADGCERALVMEDDMTFELFTFSAWARVDAALPEKFGAVRLCVAETPRLLDALYQEKGTIRSIDKVYWCAGAYVIDRNGMHSVLSKFGFSAPFDVSHFRGEQSPEHLVLQTLKDDRSIRGPFDARVPLFVFEALDSDIHPEEMPQYRRAREFIIKHHSALRDDQYRSPFPLASLARKLWSA